MDEVCYICPQFYSGILLALKNSKLSYTALLLLAMCAQQATAQFSVSPYSYYGVGVIRESFSPINRGIAGTGIGLRDYTNLNIANPAAINSIEGFSFLANLGFFGELGKYETASKANNYTGGQLNSIDLWFRLSKKWATSLDLVPYSSVDYRVSSRLSIYGNMNETLQISGKGDLNSLQWSHAYAIIPHLSVGISGVFLFGAVDHRESIISGIYNNISYTELTSFRGFSIGAGAQYELVLPKDKAIILGVVYESGASLLTNHQSNVSQSSVSLWESSKEQKDRYKPAKYGFGISFRIPRWTIASDLSYRDKKNTDANTRDTFRYSLGAYYSLLRDKISLRPSLLLRGGVYVQQNYLQINNTVSFLDYGFTMGLGIPVIDGRGVINFVYQYAQSGTTERSLIAQKANIFSLDFTFRDVWGIRVKHD